MFVEELQARIAQISADIALQREILKQLERNKNDTQRQLNALRDPVARLPFDISSEIFLQCLPRQRRPNARTGPMLLLRVCKTWTDIALSTPELWAVIDLNFPGAQILDTWLQRAGKYPLSVNLHRSLNYDTATILSRYAEQLKHFEIQEEKLEARSLTGFEPFPCLETLAVCAVPDDEETYAFLHITQTIDIFRLAPNLVQCTFRIAAFYDDCPGVEKLILPRLASLKFGDPEKCGLRYLNDDAILLHLSLPTLQTLVLPFATVSFTDLFHFLKRSSPPLETLVLGRNGGLRHFTQLADCLRLVPSLSHLEMYSPSTPFLDGFFSALADSSSHLLPNLHNVKIHHDFQNLSESSYQQLLCALSGRRTQLVCVHLRNPDESQTRPGPDVRAELRQLMDDGMDIYIGTNDSNFILF
ncbi:hypothetical protein B0H19DRAFT_652519 [Mycena capillaripes]|nr:hypothetical protein B0H19DRAFT_652519 [Mycena capillaripes]